MREAYFDEDFETVFIACKHAISHFEFTLESSSKSKKVLFASSKSSILSISLIDKVYV